MDQTSTFADFNVYSNDPFNNSNSPPLNNDVDVDWSVFENAERYLLRDDSAWITRLSKDFWWNLERISELILSSDLSIAQTINNASRSTTKYPPAPNTNNNPSTSGPFHGGKAYPSPNPSPMQFSGVPPRKIVGQQRAPMPNGNPYRTTSMFNNGFASPPPSSSSSSSSSGSAIVRPNSNQTYAPNPGNLMSDKSAPNFFQAFSSMSISNAHDQDMEYNPFQSKISFDNHMWTGNGQQAIPWQ